MNKNAVIAEATKAYEPERKGIMNRITSWVRENEDTLDVIKVGAVLAVVAGIAINYGGGYALKDAAYQAFKAGINWTTTLPPGVGEYVQSKSGYMQANLDISTALAHFHELPAYAMAKAGGFATALAGAVTVPATILLQAFAESKAPKKAESVVEAERKALHAERDAALKGLDQITAAVQNSSSSVDIAKVNEQLGEILKEVRNRGMVPEPHYRSDLDTSSNFGVALGTVAVLGSMG